MDNGMEWARTAAQNSSDPSTKVGAAIFRDGALVAAGHNRFPRGIPEDWWQDRPRKYRAVVHAEASALLTVGMAAEGATMFVTHHPCPECAKLIAAAGVAVVVCPAEPWRDDPEVRALCNSAAELLSLCGVEVRHA